MAKTAIVGAGMFGLTCALRLCQRGDAVTVFDRDGVPGGLAAGFRPAIGGDYLERFYHHIFRSDVAIARLIGELGLSDGLEWSQPITACMTKNVIAPLDSPAALLAFPALPFHDRLRLGAALALLKLSPDPSRYESIRAQQWLTRVAGSNAHDTVFRPLFEAKFGRYARDVALSWFWARIHDRTKELGYLRGGFAVLYEALADAIRRAGGTLRFNESVTAVTREPARLTVATDAGTADDFDRVIAGMPLRTLARIAPQIPDGFLSQYGEARGLGARCIVLALDRPLSPNYWINVCEPGAPFTVLVEHTNIASPQRYGGKHMVYLGNYGETFEAAPVDEVVASFVPWIRRVNPQFDPSWIAQSWQFVAADAQPVVTVGYRYRIAPHRTPVEGLYVGNLFQIYPHDRGQNYAVELAENLVRNIS